MLGRVEKTIFVYLFGINLVRTETKLRLGEYAAHEDLQEFFLVFSVELVRITVVKSQEFSLDLTMFQLLILNLGK